MQNFAQVATIRAKYDKPKHIYHLAFYALVVTLISVCFYTLSVLVIQIDQINEIKYALVGDIGGTNIRLQLLEFRADQKLPINITKDERLKVKDFSTFQQSVQYFLANIDNKIYPTVAVIAVAGPVQNNQVSLSNVPKWGRINAIKIGIQFNIHSFKFVNDFQAISYGLLIVNQSLMIPLNNKIIDQQKLIGVIGPGTGLGHSIIYKNSQKQNSIIVMPSEAGQTDFPLIDNQSLEYFNFLKQKLETTYISLQKSFCGPTIPLIYQFQIKKHPQLTPLQLSSQQIIEQCIKPNSEPIFNEIFSLFMKYYSSAIGNFMANHMTIGGIYLVGSLTQSIVQKIKNTNILGNWIIRHPEMENIVSHIPIVFCNQTDLGLKGAFVVAKNLYNNNKNSIEQFQQQIKLKNYQQKFDNDDQYEESPNL